MQTAELKSVNFAAILN